MNILENFKDLKIRSKKDSIVVGVLAGGISAEREVSLKTGKKIYNALRKLKYNTMFIDPKNNLIEDLKKIDIAFLALHGRYGEDGTIQGLLELLKIPYTGSGVLASAIVLNKLATKKFLEYEKIKTPPYVGLNFNSEIDINKIKEKVEKFSYPAIVKPNSEGSTIGITIVNNEENLLKAIEIAAKHDNEVIIEKYIKGRELTVSIIGDEPIALPIIEIKPKSGFYDYEAKYTVNMTEYIVPAKIDKKITKEIKGIGIKCHKILGCANLSRVDLIFSENNVPYVLEVNTMPGMTPTSLVPKAAEAAGISFEVLVEILLNNASLKIDG